mmetsp:Transcript_19528/g.42493  ORF Transcript_19528/g.42493 Transcript_19528/m.42493 type:complete len:206 (-) Transcript_19528:453-1070(-)
MGKLKRPVFASCSIGTCRTPSHCPAFTRYVLQERNLNSTKTSFIVSPSSSFSSSVSCFIATVPCSLGESSSPSSSVSCFIAAAAAAPPSRFCRLALTLCFCSSGSAALFLLAVPVVALSRLPSGEAIISFLTSATSASIATNCSFSTFIHFFLIFFLTTCSSVPVPPKDSADSLARASATVPRKVLNTLVIFSCPESSCAVAGVS